MQQVTTLDTQIINNLNSHLVIFKYSDSELEALTLGILERIKSTTHRISRGVR